MSCTSCHLDLRSTTYAKCAECNVPSVQVCLPCFTGNYEAGRHLKDHSYFVISGDYSSRVKLNEFSLEDVLALLDSARRFSVGAWEEMRARARVSTSSKCEVAFMELYNRWSTLSQSGLPNPKYWIDSTALLRGKQTGGGLSVLTIPTPASSSDMQGFLPNRVDFEVEYDDSAELILADIEFGNDDSSADIATKMELLKAFNQRMTRRESAKLFAVDHLLVSAEIQMAFHRSRTTEEMNLRGKLRPIERYFPNAFDFDCFVQMLLAESRLEENLYRLLNQTKEIPSSSECPDNKAGLHRGPDSIQETEKALTRSKTSSDSRRGRTIEEECCRIMELFTQEPQLFTDMSSQDQEAFTKIDGTSFPLASLKPILTRMFGNTGTRTVDMQLSRVGDLLTVRASTNG